MKIVPILTGTALIILGVFIGYQITMAAMSTCATSFEPGLGIQNSVPFVLCISGGMLMLYGFFDPEIRNSEKKEILQKEERGVQ